MRYSRLMLPKFKQRLRYWCFARHLSFVQGASLISMVLLFRLVFLRKAHDVIQQAFLSRCEPFNVTLLMSLMLGAVFPGNLRRRRLLAQPHFT